MPDDLFAGTIFATLFLGFIIGLLVGYERGLIKGYKDTKKFEKQKDKVQWVPKINEDYWTLTNCYYFSSGPLTWFGNSHDQDKLARGWVFKTEEEAEQYKLDNL